MDEDKNDKIEITSEMIAAGEKIIWSRVGGASDLGGWFCARELAKTVYLAMAEKRDLSKIHP